MAVERCPCDSGKEYRHCCGPLLSGEQPAGTAEQLMRSRYTAFVLADEKYLRKTWHPQTCPSRIEVNDGSRWLGLKIRSIDRGGVHDDEGTVEFVARYKVAGRGHRLHEASRFIRLQGQWRYLDGDHQD
jgi:SEC-C motif-containing protein